MQQSHTPQPYRVYIAAASTRDQIQRAQTWASRLAKAGIAVVSTWTATVAAAGTGNPRDATLDDRRRWAVQDIAELGRANALWLLAPPPGITTRGAWAELGAAYARALLIVSSGDTAQSVFTALGVEYERDEQAFDGLVLVATGRRGPDRKAVP